MFEHPDAEVFPVISGTAANSLALAALCPPWGAVLCHETAHILQSECGATSMFGGGAVMRGVGGEHFRLTPDRLRAGLRRDPMGRPAPLAAGGAVADRADRSRHRSTRRQRWPSSLTLAEPSVACESHLDGARVANAVAALGCIPAELTWRAGIDALSLGAMKNGALSTDAIVCFDPAISEQLVYRIKRAGHVASKMRFQSVQLDGIPHRRSVVAPRGHSNEAMTRLADGLRSLDVEFLNTPDVNMLFARVDPHVADRMAESGLLFYRMSTDTIRLVTSFQTTDDEIDEALSGSNPPSPARSRQPGQLGAKNRHPWR